jgi:hypothetical protein
LVLSKRWGKNKKLYTLNKNSSANGAEISFRELSSLVYVGFLREIISF